MGRHITKLTFELWLVAGEQGVYDVDDETVNGRPQREGAGG